MVHVFYTDTCGQLSEESFNDYLGELPFFLQSRVQRLRDKKDAQRSLIGWCLLLKALHNLGISEKTIENLQFTAQGRPYLNADSDFNISHSGGYCVCVISQMHKVGVDVEAVKKVELAEFQNVFDKAEWQVISESSTPLQAFYTLWTKKEALLKARGTGLLIDPSGINAVEEAISIEGETWYWFPLLLDEAHIAHITCNTAAPVIKSHYVLLDAQKVIKSLLVDTASSS